MTDDLPQQRPALEALDIRKRFGDQQVLDGVSLHAHEGEVIALIGASGAGKSTLLRCLNLLETPDTGTIRLDGEALELCHDPRRQTLQPIDKKQLRRFRMQVGFVFQTFNLWPHLSVLQNVIEALLRVRKLPKPEAVAIGLAMLEGVGLTQKQNAWPETLSSGEQQRVAIARALAMDPKVLLLDEPTSALDPERVGEVLQVLRDLARQRKTMLLVTHEIRFAREVADRVLFLDQGRIAEQGPPDEVLENPQTERLQQFLRRILNP